MSGLIIGAQGLQRSGKTFIMCSIAQFIANEQNIPVYSNIIVNDKNWHFINSVEEIPFNFEPKIVLVDEIYNGADAINYKKLSDLTIFINTIGKQNILFLFTTIDFNMVYNRIRTQMNYVLFVKKDRTHINYRCLDVNLMTQMDYSLRICPELFKRSKYDTNYVPIDFNWDMTNFKKRLVDYYKQEYPQLLKYLD